MIIMNNLKYSPLILLILIVPPSIFATSISTGNDVDFDFFSDNFNRADSTIVGNGWFEYDSSASGIEAEIINNALSLSDNSTNSIPCVEVPINITNQTGTLYVDYTYDFAPLGIFHDTNFIIHMRLGEDLVCGNGAGKVLTLSHANHDRFFKFDFPVNDPPNEQNFGYISGAKMPIGKINGTVNISIQADLENKLIDIRTTGPGLIFGNGTKLDLPYSDITKKINSMYFMVNGVADYMPPVIIDNLEVQRFDYHTCGIEVQDYLDYGLVKPGEYSEKTLMMNATGDYGSTIKFQVGDWLDENSNIVVGGEKTRYTLDENVSYTSKESLRVNDDAVLLGIIPTNGTLLSYWETKLVVDDESFIGPITQEMTFIILCN